MKLLLLTLALSVTVVIALDNGLALTPPMGWLDWERFRCNIDCVLHPADCISERLFTETADRMAADGYMDAGYQYVVVDDCWLAKSRDTKGRLQPDASRFPHGMKWLADYIHNKGLLFGIYEDIGTKTCEGYPGDEGHFEADAQTFAEWTADYVKLDGCYAEPIGMNISYPQFSVALNKTGRPMVFSCSWPDYVRLKGLPLQYELMKKYCNLWRNFDDIQDTYKSLYSIIDYWASPAKAMIDIAGPGVWNDPDMLIIGDNGLSVDEQKMQMAIWAVVAAPLLMSNDLRKISAESKAILINKEVIAIDQDKLGKQGYRLWRQASGAELWKRVLDKNALAVAAVYRVQPKASAKYPQASMDIQINWPDLGLAPSAPMEVRDVFSHTTLGVFTGAYTARNVPLNGVAFFKFTPK